jgi:SAM-dependent methyltransferase
MKLSEAISLIDNPYINIKTSRWTDLGCGKGLFTRALSQLLHHGSTIYAVDSNKTALQSFSDPPGIFIERVELDFIERDLPFRNLDGILMANSFHYAENKVAFISKMETCFKEGAMFLIVEYDLNIANRWVPYPLSFSSLTHLFEKSGYSFIKKLHEHPSVFQRASMYSAIVRK